MVDAAASEYYGTVKSFNARKGWGFLECTETQQIYGKDILVQKAELPAQAFPGDSVSFSVTQGKNGVIAVSVQLLDKDGFTPVASGSYTGSVKSFSHQSGWGFVECAETQQMYGKDIMILEKELNGQPVSPGDTMSFSVMQGRKGPLATNIQVLTSGGGHVGNVGLQGAIGAMRPKAPVQVVSAGKRAREEADGCFVGTIKSFNTQRGWGFIECAETQSIYGKDIMVLKEELGPWGGAPGMQVSFTVGRGKTGPIAKTVNPFGSHMRNTRPRMSPMQALPAAAMPMHVAAGRGASGPSRPAKAAPQGQVCGTIKSFDENKGWGFITGPEILKAFGKDVYMSRNALQGQTVSQGDQVSFKVDMGMKGPMATNVMVLPQGAIGAEGMTGEITTGIVKSFNAEKGWGFVTSDEATQMFGKDLFLHKRELGDWVPNAGDQVQFVVQMGSGGRPEAAKVSPAGGAAPMQAMPGMKGGGLF